VNYPFKAAAIFTENDTWPGDPLYAHLIYQTWFRSST